MIKKKSKPKFSVPNFKSLKKVKERWRQPRGHDNKKRVKYKYTGASPTIGYKNSPEVRGMHPSGFFEVLIHNAIELKTAKGKVARIAASVGKKKRQELKKLADELNIKLLNYR